MKIKGFKRIVVLVLTFLLAIGLMSGVKASDVEAADSVLVLKASQLNAANKIYIDFSVTGKSLDDYSELKFVLDEDFHATYSSFFKKNITIEGDKTLYLKNCANPLMFDVLRVKGCNLTLKENANIVLNGNSVEIEAENDGDKKANINIYGNIKIDKCHEIYSQNNINIYGGNIIVGNSNNGIEALNINMYGGNIEAMKPWAFGMCAYNELNIYGGTISGGDVCAAGYYPDDDYRLLYAVNNLNISGGELNLSPNCISAYSKGNINISGGKISFNNAKSGFVSELKTTISGGTVSGMVDGTCIKSSVVSITGGYVDLKSLNSNVIDASTSVSGGESYLVSLNASAISGCDRFNFSGGYINLKTSEGYTPISMTNSGVIDIDENYHISKPENGIVGYRMNPNDSSVKIQEIQKSDGTIPTEVEFKENYDLSQAEVSGVEDQYFTGGAITQYPVVKIDGTVLTEGTDYTVSYSNNVSVGTATVTISAVKGSHYKGSISKTFKIKPYCPDDESGSNGKTGNKRKYSNEWVDGKWYYFLDSGYMDYSGYRDGCYLGSDGAWVEEYYGGHWCSDSAGWWYEDASGWYPAGQWLWIDGKCYYFETDGYLATNKYIDGYWVGADGAY